jgi:hypothetical protein
MGVKSCCDWFSKLDPNFFGQNRFWNQFWKIFVDLNKTFLTKLEICENSRLKVFAPIFEKFSEFFFQNRF